MAGAIASIPAYKGEGDRRALEALFAPIRQQLAALHASVAAVTGQIGQSSLASGQSNSSISNLQSQITALTNLLTQVEIGGGAPTVQYRADGDIGTNDVVLPSSDIGVSSVNTQNPAAIFAVAGIAESSATAGAQVTVRRAGVMSIAGAGFDVGGAVYAQVGGGLTQHPNYAKVAIPVGVAITTTSMVVMLGWPTLLDASLGGPEEYMPISYGQAQALSSAVTSVNGQSGAVSLFAADVGAMPDPDLVSPTSGLNGTELFTVQQAGVMVQATIAMIAALSGAVASVNGHTGAVVLAAADVGAVASVNGHGGTVTLLAADVGAVPDPDLVSPTSGLTGAELVTVQQGGVMVQTTTQHIADLAPASRSGVGALVDGGTISVNASAHDCFRVTLGGNRALANPTGMSDGQTLLFRIIQDATGSRTLTYGSKYKFPGGTAPTLSTAIGAVDLLTAQYDATDDTLVCVMNLAFA